MLHDLINAVKLTEEDGKIYARGRSYKEGVGNNKRAALADFALKNELPTEGYSAEDNGVYVRENARKLGLAIIDEVR